MRKGNKRNGIKVLIDSGKKTLNKEINRCPRCGKGILPVYVDDCIIDNIDLIMIQYCPLCGEIIIAHYKVALNDETQWCMKNTYPYDIGESEKENEIIKKVSPKFYDIFRQARAAEIIGLYEICGIGYRKALEFLVKDYAIYKNPNDIEKIIAKPLQQCIDTYIDYDEVKKCAKGATYIGNDETHYTRKWENKDIEDLKNLIKMMILWIELYEQTLIYSKDMNL